MPRWSVKAAQGNAGSSPCSSKWSWLEEFMTWASGLGLNCLGVRYGLHESGRNQFLEGPKNSFQPGSRPRQKMSSRWKARNLGLRGRDLRLRGSIGGRNSRD